MRSMTLRTDRLREILQNAQKNGSEKIELFSYLEELPTPSTAVSSVTAILDGDPDVKEIEIRFHMKGKGPHDSFYQIRAILTYLLDHGIDWMAYCRDSAVKTVA